MQGNDLKYKQQLLSYMMETTNHAFDRVHLTTSGSEAVEWAVKPVQKMTDRSEVVSFWNSIHGRTHYSASMSGLPKRKAGYPPLSPGIIFSPYPDCIRCSFNCSNKDNCNFYCLEFLDRKLEYESANDLAAVIIEPYQAEGNTFPPEEYLKALKDWTHKKGAKLIFDETQSGMGRNGVMYHYLSPSLNVTPDIMLLGKALDNGLHIAAFLIKGELELKDINAMTGGAGDSVLSCAAACAVYKELLEVGLLEQTGDYFKSGLLNLKEKHNSIVQVRGTGLALAIDFMESQPADKLTGI
ncbi:MAG: aminotransferase class III-fold pyridoxal phosphate-dependent enzyme [Defluviitaleaceae bacterium]|nr:aminotransferase class III-fold pyridoxal phosphate-dependent enzyme [Defluviitaleaceae bacterium]